LRLFTSLTEDHYLPVIVLAAMVCVMGCLLSMRLLRQSYKNTGVTQLGLVAMTASCLSATLWSTHFIAMMGYRPSAAVYLDPHETLASGLIMLAGAMLSVYLATLKHRFSKMLAGLIFGLALGGMNYEGMVAYHVNATVAWDPVYVTASLLVGVAFAILGFELSPQDNHHLKRLRPGLCLVAAAVGLHFISMAGYDITPLAPGDGLEQGTFQALTFAAAIAGLIVVSLGAASYAMEANQRERADHKLRHLALHDALTGLPNRICFSAMLEQMLSDRGDGKVAVIMIDLNRFKEINDVWGHQAGDTVLTDIAQRLRTGQPEGGHAARLGGDEFAILLPLKSETRLEQELVVIEQLFCTPVRHADFEIITGASLGVAVCPEDGEDQETLLRNADLAMYKAKADPLNTVQLYEHALGDAVRERRDLTRDLRLAIQHDGLEMHYQPQIDLSTGEVCGYEALVRWPHADKGWVPPDTFVPLAEANGLISRLGDWVLTRSCSEAVLWDQPHKVAVNISAIQLNDPNLAQKVLQVLLDTGLPAARLELELTETALIQDLQQSLNVLRRIKALGVSLALDDFGTGYSALETLRRFPFDKIKLDKSFTDGLFDGGRSRAVISAVVTLARNLSIPVLAEGVETTDQLEVLHADGCVQAQGFLIGRPGAMVDQAPPAIEDVMWRQACPPPHRQNTGS